MRRKVVRKVPHNPFIAIYFTQYWKMQEPQHDIIINKYIMHALY